MLTDAIIRLATYEMLYTDTPASIIINEAIEITIMSDLEDGTQARFNNGSWTISRRVLLMLENKYVTVSALNRYIFHKFDKDVHLQQVYLKGEISNFKASGKHFYFSLKDDKSEISAMMFFPDNLNIRFKPADGVNVQVVGQVRVYEKRGTYSILVKQMEEEGVGALYAAFLALKDKLQKEGLFDERHKKPIPEYPMEVGIVTAATGCDS